MNLMLLLEMAANVEPERVALGPKGEQWTYERLFRAAGGCAHMLENLGVRRVVHTAETSPALVVGLFGAAWAGVPFAPLNYRLADDQLRVLAQDEVPALAIVDPGTEHRLAGIEGLELITTHDLLEQSQNLPSSTTAWSQDPEDIAVLLFTSGTSGPPKAAVLRHKHLTSYVLGSVEFLGAGSDEATLASVPPYHIAAISGVLTALYSGRRLVQLPAFRPQDWVELARTERITHAMTVPTMLGRILDELDTSANPHLPSLRHISYGGGRMPVPVIERAMALLGHVDFVNAYGLTETSSSIAVLTPQDHRDAIASDDPIVRRRLGSVGRPLPTVDITVRDDHGQEVPANTEGEIWVRGEQVSGEYQHRSADGASEWFRTNDGGFLDSEGYLYVNGRLDDVIVRGGENLSPGEIEDTLLQHPAVKEAAVVGVPDTEWGEAVAAVVVCQPGQSATTDELADFVVSRLRSSRRPQIIEFREELPETGTGKILRRLLREELIGGS